MLTTEIKEQIDMLEQDKMVCRRKIQNPATSDEEKIECRNRLRADMREISRLNILYIALQGDELLYGKETNNENDKDND